MVALKCMHMQVLMEMGEMLNLSFSGEDGISCDDEFALVNSVWLVLVVFVGDGGSVASGSKLSSYSLLPLLLVPFKSLVLGSFVT